MLFSETTINVASLIFENCAGNGNCDGYSSADGWGIDDATVGLLQISIPEPGSLALLGIGLFGLGAAGRKAA